MKQEMVKVDEELAKKFIARERFVSILAGLGYISLMASVIVWSGMSPVPANLSVVVFLLLLVLSLVLIFAGSFGEKEEYRLIKNNLHEIDEETANRVSERYKKAKLIYMAVYIISIAAIVSIIGRSMYIIQVLKACPRNDHLTYAYACVAFFCFSYASGVMGAYKSLLKKTTNQ